MNPRALLVPVLASALLLAACGNEDPETTSLGSTSTPMTSPEPTTSPVTSPAASPSASASPTGGSTGDETDGAEPDFRADAGPATAPGEGNGLSVVDVRVGEHEGFDRVVFELDGTGTAGWRVQYDDAPTTQGEGRPVELAGDATLTVAIEGVGYPFDTGVEEYSGPRQQSPGLSSVQELQLGGVFEGYYEAFVGVAEQRPFRVFRLQDPQRVVIDVAYGD